MLTVSAYAKINLVLEVLGRRFDGYHEVATVLQEVDLKDVLTLEEHVEVRLEPEDDLVVKAVKLLGEVGKCRRGISISITKGIPVAAGLGGSSSDAAAALRGLNDLWGLGLTLSQLAAVASRVSADTSFFLYGGTALGEGRGEVITPLPSPPPAWVVLLRPPVALPPQKTATLYSSLNRSHFTDGERARRAVDLLRQGGDVPQASLFNAFEQVACAAFPGLETYWRRFRELGAGAVHLAGSGPTLFTMLTDRSQAAGLYQSLEEEGLEAYLVQTKTRP